MRGVTLLYRRNKTNGSWVVKASDGHGAYWTKSFADADDYENSDGTKVLTFYEAHPIPRRSRSPARSTTTKSILRRVARTLVTRAGRVYTSPACSWSSRCSC